MARDINDDDTFADVSWWPPVCAPRIAIIDIGSNAMRLAIFEIVDGQGYEVYNERARPQLGRELDPGGRLAPHRVVDALGGLARFAWLSRRMGVKRTHAVATAAIRMATAFDRRAFIAEASTILSAPVRVLSGAEEARLSAEGVLADLPDARGLVADIGGLSLELAPVGQGRVLDQGLSFELGPMAVNPLLNGAPTAQGRADVQARVCQLLKPSPLDRWAEFETDTVYGVGGAWRNIAACHMQRTNDTDAAISGYTIAIDAMRETLGVLIAADDAARALMATSEVSRRRQNSLPTAALVLDRTLECLASQQVVMSTSGVRKGVLMEALRRKPMPQRWAIKKRRTRRPE